MDNKSVIKKLSKNDLGITGSHQSGFVVPKWIVGKGFFPFLDPQEYNPRKNITVLCDGKTWSFSYIYYNNRLHGLGTRNEYRMTGLSKFFRDTNCSVGDSLRIISTEREDFYYVEIIRAIGIDDYLSSKLIIRADWAW